MKLESKRLFISNLPEIISQADIEKKFNKFGRVIGIDIKERKNIGPNQTSLFAYIQINIDETNLQDCFQEFATKSWNGFWIDVKEAKESFMERLKRERGEQQQKSNGTIIPVSSNNISSQYEVNSTSIKRVYNSENSDDDHAMKDVPQQSSSNENEIIIMKNKTINIKGGLKIESVGKQPIATIEIGKKRIKVDDKNVSEADKKRIQSVLHMRNEYQQQKSLIQKSLSNVDSIPQNKIIFNDDEDDIHSVSIPTKNLKYDEPVGKRNQTITSNHLQLFQEAEDDGEDENYNFEVREHLDGRKGQKLMELQTKFKNDKRFAMDARFLEEDFVNEAGLNSIDQCKPTESDQEISLEEEKRKQFDILEEVLGTKVSRNSTDKTEKTKFKMMLRFDPSQPNHSKYEDKEPLNQEKRKRKKNAKDQIENKIIDDTPKPEVSKDTYYKVTVDLKNTLQEEKGFSLASLFKDQIESTATEVEEKREQTMKKSDSEHKSKKLLMNEPNPFKYDSSSDETDKDEEELVNAHTIQEDNKKINNVNFKKLTTGKLWIESFFFKNDDYRLQEGLDFIKRLELDDQENFVKLRRNLHEIVKAKVRNTQRKNRPFKRKLGGKKRIRIKRAMKR